MLFALGAASTALDAIRSLTSNVSSGQAAGGFSEASNLFDVTSSATPLSSSASASVSNGYSQLSPETMSALLAAQGQTSTGATTSTSTSPSSALQDLFSQIDANGDGAISKTEFENALGAGGTNIAQADKVFGELDKNGDGSVSMSELQSALKGAGGKGGHHHHAHAASSGDSSGSTTADGTSSTTGTSGSSGSGGSDPLLQALAGASGNSTTNSNGSTTTSLTFADGSSVSMTSPAAATSSSSATASYNFLEQMIQREAQAISTGGTSALSFNA
jgi:Ca2+-binding EF-hand superfamily protein